jgi:hypothetical protein
MGQASVATGVSSRSLSNNVALFRRGAPEMGQSVIAKRLKVSRKNHSSMLI